MLTPYPHQNSHKKEPLKNLGAQGLQCPRQGQRFRHHCYTFPVARCFSFNIPSKPCLLQFSPAVPIAQWLLPSVNKILPMNVEGNTKPAAESCPSTDPISSNPGHHYGQIDLYAANNRPA